MAMDAEVASTMAEVGKAFQVDMDREMWQGSVQQLGLVVFKDLFMFITTWGNDFI